MQRTSTVYGHDIYPVKSDGTKLDRDNTDPSLTGYTLASGTTYLYPLGRAGKESPYQSVQVKWDQFAVLTITVEDTNFVDVNSYSTTVGDWQKEDPTTAYVAHDGGSTVTNATVTVPGGTAGGCMFNLGQLGALRTRLKIVVGGTGGVVRVAQNMKD